MRSTLLVLVLLALALGTYATRYDYRPWGSLVVRTNRWTGRSELLLRSGWRPMQRDTAIVATTLTIDPYAAVVGSTRTDPQDSLLAVRQGRTAVRP